MADLSRIIYLNQSQIATLQESPDAEIEIDKVGIASAQLTYHCRFDLAVTLVLRLTSHPDYPWLKRSKATISRQEGYIASVRVTFEGINPDAGTGGGEGAPEEEASMSYSISTTMDTVPIEAHPNFSEFAGDPSDPTTWLNGARFDRGTKEFLGFSPTDGAPNKKAGVKSFLSPATTYEVVRVIANWASLDDAAKSFAIRTPGRKWNTPFIGGTNAPDVPGRDWLYVGLSVQQVGDGARLTQTFRMSGDGGWDADIYQA